MNDIQMLPEENFLNHGFQLYKIRLDQKTLNLIQALLMELSLISNKSILNDSFARNKEINVGLMEGIMKVLEWRVNGNINDNEFAMLYVEWLKSKQFVVNDHLISFSYDLLVPKNTIINYLRNQKHEDLSFVVSQYMEILNSQFNEHLSTIANIQPKNIEISEDIYIMFDDEGIGYVGIDQMIFLFMVLVKKQRLNMPYSKNQFYSEFQTFVSQIPQINGNISLRSFKAYIVLSQLSSDGIQEILESCQDLMNEFGWNQHSQQESSDVQFIFPKPFNEAFVECMNTLHQQGYIANEDLMRDEFLNTYNIFLNEDYFKILGESNNHSSYINCLDLGKFQRALFSNSLEFFNERVLSSLNIKLSQNVFSCFVNKFDQKIQQYIATFTNKYIPQSYQSYQSYDSRQDLNQQKGSKVFSKSRQNKPSTDMKAEMQRLEKENYKPKINFDDSSYNNFNNNYHSWNESYSNQNDLQNKSTLPFFQASVQQTIPSRNSIKDNSYLDSLQNNINKNIKNMPQQGRGFNVQTNQPQFQQQKQQLFQQFMSKNQNGQHNSIEYNIKLTDLGAGQQSKLGANNISSNKNLRNRSKSPVQSYQMENQAGMTFNNKKIQAPQMQRQQSQAVSKPPLDARQNLRYSNNSFSNQDNRQLNSNNSRQKLSSNSYNSILRQVTPTKSVSPIKFYISLSNSQKQINLQQKPFINEFQPNPSQSVSFQKQTASSKLKNFNQQGSSVKKAKSSLNMRTNSIENVNHFNSDIQLRQQTSMGFREQTPDKKYQANNNSNQNESSNLKNRKTSISSNNYMQQSLNNFQNQSTALQRSKSPQVRKSQTIQMWNKRIEPFEKVMQRLTSQQSVSPMKEMFKKRPFH
ncbi:hypothetical protein ABPG72_002019 [Tetrahymena utriculariae]